MGEWHDVRTDRWHETWQPPCEVTVTENPVVGVLYGPDGRVVHEVRERRPIGFR